MQAARRATRNRVEEQMMLLSWLTRLLLKEGCPVHLNPLTWTGAKSDWHYVVCIHSSKGQMTWRLSDLEVESWFQHLEKKRCRYDGHTRDEKLNRLADLLEALK